MRRNKRHDGDTFNIPIILAVIMYSILYRLGKAYQSSQSSNMISFLTFQLPLVPTGTICHTGRSAQMKGTDSPEDCFMKVSGLY